MLDASPAACPLSREEMGMSRTERNDAAAKGKPARGAAGDAETNGPRAFLSWSGARSKPAAEAFKKFLQTKMPTSKPWVSSLDIPSLGSKQWKDEIFEALDSCDTFATHAFRS
jgi:hypothetical protein